MPSGRQTSDISWGGRWRYLANMMREYALCCAACCQITSSTIIVNRQYVVVVRPSVRLSVCLSVLSNCNVVMID